MIKSFYGFLWGLFGLILTACSDKDANAAKQSSNQTRTSFPVLEVPTRTVTAYRSYPTNIEGMVNSEVRAKVSGYVTDVLVDEGETVRRGQPLFKLETQSLSQDAAASKANVNAARVEVEKLEPLVEKGIISEVQLQTAKAQLAQAESNYNSVIANIGYATIRSPVDGVVGSINYRRGALVSAQDQIPLTRVSTIDQVYAYFSVNEKDFLQFMQLAEGKSMEERIRNLPKVKLVLASGSEYPQEGTIETISGDIDPLTGTVTFRAKFGNDSGLLRNGSSGTIKIPQTFEDAVVIPALSTYEQQGKVMVYRVEDDSLVTTTLEIVSEVNNLYVVGDGVEKGQVILARGAGKVRPGTRIDPVEVPLDSLIGSFDTVFK